MSQRYTLITLPDRSVGGWAEHDRIDSENIIGVYRRRAMRQMIDSLKILLAKEDDYRIETFLGIHARKKTEIIQEGKHSEYDDEALQRIIVDLLNAAR